MSSVFLFVLVRCLCWGLGVYLSWVHWHQLLNGLPGLWKFVLAESLEKGVIILLGAASSTGVSFGGGLGEYPEVLPMENPGRGDPIGASAPEHSLPSSVPGGDNDLNSSPSQGENGVPRASKKYTIAYSTTLSPLRGGWTNSWREHPQWNQKRISQPGSESARFLKSSWTRPNLISSGSGSICGKGAPLLLHSGGETSLITSHWARGAPNPLINQGVQLTCTDRPLLYWN